MRQSQHSKRSRGRGRKQNNSPNRSFESSGPEVKIRGNASHIADKYLALARDSHTGGDPISAENYLQHAEHYFRVVAANAASKQERSQEGKQPDNAATKAPNGNGAEGQPVAQESNGAAAEPQKVKAKGSSAAKEDKAHANGADAADDGRVDNTDSAQETDGDKDKADAIVTDAG